MTSENMQTDQPKDGRALSATRMAYLNPRRRAKTPTPEYFEKMSIPEPNTGCWLWLGSYSRGYAKIYSRGWPVASNAHRASFIVHNPGIDVTDLQIDHLCRNTACVNPAHLEAVTQQENARRRDLALARDTCPHGHTYDHVDNRGSKRCRQCNRAAKLRHRAKVARAALRTAAEGK